MKMASGGSRAMFGCLQTLKPKGVIRLKLLFFLRAHIPFKTEGENAYKFLITCILAWY